MTRARHKAKVTRRGRPHSTKTRAPNLVPRRQLAARLAVHMQTITKWEREGMPIAERGRKGRPSLYREIEVRAWHKAREKAAQHGGRLDMIQERARKEKWQGLLAEQQYLLREQELLPREEIEKVWAAEVSAVRAALLSWSTTLADKVHRVSTLEGLPGVERVLQDAVRDVLREFSDPHRPLPGVTPPSTPSGKAAAA